MKKPMNNDKFVNPYTIRIYVRDYLEKKQEIVT